MITPRYYGLWKFVVLTVFGSLWSLNAQTDVAQKSEESWVIHSVVTDIARLSAYAAKKPLPEASMVEISLKTPGEKPVYAVNVHLPGQQDVVSNTVVVNTTAFDPTVYSAIGKAIIQRYSITIDKSKFSSSAVVTLQVLTPENLKSENKKISEFLALHPTNVDANEAAAVLLGALAMRENSGWLWNPMGECKRATAFLAFAESLQGKPTDSSSALLTNLLIGLMLDTKVECQKQIAELERRSLKESEFGPWVNAAKFRNTRDWRPEANEKATLVEKIEKFRAYADGAATGPAISYLEEINAPMITDWPRIVLSVGYSVGDGHTFTKAYLQQEMGEISKIMDFPMPKGEAGFPAFIKMLNVPSAPVVLTYDGGKQSLEVIDAGIWCQTAQRHICHAIYQTWYFMENKWGVKDDARDFWQVMTKIFSDMEMFPLIALQSANSSEKAKVYADRLNGLFTKQPQLVPDIVWVKAGEGSYASLFPNIASLTKQWFSPPVLTGSAYRAALRLHCLPEYKNSSKDELARLYAIAPLQQEIAEKYFREKLETNRNIAEFRRLAGSMLDYDFEIMRMGGEYFPNDPAFQEEILKKMASVDANNFARLGRFYVKTNNPEQAVEAYQSMVDHASNSVLAANECGWLVNYYYDHGQKEKAIKVAKFAAEVYSYTGLQIYAELFEKMGDLSKAEEYYGKIQERYEDRKPLYLFYQKHIKESPAYEEKSRKLMAGLFPAGLRDVTVSDFKNGEPKRGIRIQSSSPLLIKNGMQIGDIIVALDGKATDTLEQYDFVRSLSKSPQLDLIVFQNGAYREIKVVTEKNRLMGVNLDAVK